MILGKRESIVMVWDLQMADVLWRTSREILIPLTVFPGVLVGAYVVQWYLARGAAGTGTSADERVERLEWSRLSRWWKSSFEPGDWDMAGLRRKAGRAANRTEYKAGICFNYIRRWAKSARGTTA
jgi:hypothetical protein